MNRNDSVTMEQPLSLRQQESLEVSSTSASTKLVENMEINTKIQDIPGKVLEGIIGGLDYNNQLKIRQVCSAFNSKVCELSSKNRLTLLNDIHAVESYFSVMKGCTELIRNELAFSMDINHPTVQALFDELGPKIKLLYIFDPLCTPEILKTLLSKKVTNVRFFSMYLSVEKFEGKSLFNLDDNNEGIQKFELPNLEGLCLDSGGKEGNLSSLALDILELSSSKLENLLLNFKSRIPLIEIIKRVKSPIENLFIGWKIEEDDVTELIKTRWPLEQLRLQLTNGSNLEFSPVALYAILEQFCQTLQVFSNYSLTLPTTIENNPYYLTMVPPIMKSLVSLQLENVLSSEPGILSHFPNIQDLRIRPFELKDALNIIAPNDKTIKYLTIRDLEVQVLSEITDQLEMEEHGCLLIQVLSESMPNIHKLVLPGTDKILANISKYMTKLQELRLDGYFSDVGIIGSNGTDLNDNVEPNVNISNLKELRILHLSNVLRKHGVTSISIHNGLLACKKLRKVFLFGDDKLVHEFYSARRTNEEESDIKDETNFAEVNIGTLTI